MGNNTSPHRSATPALISQKRPLEDEQHVPAVSSPLNPDSTTSRARRPPPREQREKKESLKKREAKVGDNVRGGTPDVQSNGKKTRNDAEAASVLSLARYKLPAPKLMDFDPPKAPIFTPIFEKAERQFYECSEHVFNRKGYRYIHCICDPSFPSSQYHRQSETEPYGPRFSFEDASNHVFFDLPGRSITTEKGFRMARSNVGAREGRWYWECKILSGVKPSESRIASPSSGGHVRLGWARREASLDTPVGFDAYSYGLRDVAGQKVHMSRPKDFVTPASDFCEGDVIGMEITLPSLSFHRKIVDGTYNKAVDVSDDVDPPHPAEAPNIIRDRLPIRYKNQIYFEAFEYYPTKELEDLMNPVPVVSSTTTGSAGGNAGPPAQPSPNHPIPALRTLPFSSIRVYRNGHYVGEPFSQLLSFLPPASKPQQQLGSREGLDDGLLGYFPAVSVFRGGAAEVNFGPDFWFPPPGLEIKPKGDSDGDIDMIGGGHPAEPVTPASGLSAPLRPISDRFGEQIAEETVYDIIDEVDFWAQDTFGEKEGPDADQGTGLGEKVSAVFLGPVDPESPDVRAVVQQVVDSGRMVGSNGEGVIKEVIQEDE